MTKDKKRQELHNLLQKAPKPQLHLHLDGSLSFKFIKESIERMKISNPERAKNLFEADWEPKTEEELRDWLMNLKQIQFKEGSVMKKKSNWKVFDFCNQFLQTEEDLYSATYELVVTLNEQHNVNYIEIRFAPVLHTLLDMDEKTAVWAVINGYEGARKYLASQGITVHGGIILCALRSFPESHARETLNLVKDMNDVLGFDIAGDEGTYPLSLFEDVLRSAKEFGVKTTVHAGEWDEKTNATVLQNINLAVDIAVDRIGHGLALRSAPKILNEINEKGIYVEVCLTANCGNPNKCKSYAEHPVTVMLKNNVRVAGFNCDNLLLSGNKKVGAPDPTVECLHALLDCSVDPLDFLNVIENGYKAGFHDRAYAVCEESIKLWRENYLPKIVAILTGE